VSVNYSINENSGPPKSCTLDIWPVTSKRLPTPGLHLNRILNCVCGWLFKTEQG